LDIERRRQPGMVYLVGAGPGRPDLITLRGAECLARADAVMVDALVDRRLLEHCRPDAVILNAGKRGHGRVLMRQPAINRLLARLARSGKIVVRLKGGDPYFFGRGGEEAAYLRAANVPFEVVPGVSSVNAVPAYAGIPLTHRQYTSMVTIVTGHSGAEDGAGEEKPARDRWLAPGVDWKNLSPGQTLVILMGLSRLPVLVGRLLAAGWPMKTPAAVIQWGTFPFQRSVEGTLEDIAFRARAAGLGSPAVIVAGPVVTLRDALNWYERLPLFGRTILVTRTRTQASEFARLLETRGAHVLESPAIRVRELPLTRLGRGFLKRLASDGPKSYDGVFFSSANAVRAFLKHWSRIRRPWPRSAAVYAVGPKTAEALVAAGLPVHGIAREFVAESLAALAGEVGGKRYLFPRAEEGRDVLLQALNQRDASVDLWPLYRTLPENLSPDVRKKLLNSEIDCVTFTSSSTVTSLFRQIPRARRKKIFQKTVAASIGPITAQTLRALGVNPVIQAPRSTTEDLAEAVTRYFQGRSRG
jgi:uroporphyrinogen III methyltransferase / synthase